MRRSRSAPAAGRVGLGLVLPGASLAVAALVASASGYRRPPDAVRSTLHLPDRPRRGGRRRPAHAGRRLRARNAAPGTPPRPLRDFGGIQGRGIDRRQMAVRPRRPPPPCLLPHTAVRMFDFPTSIPRGRHAAGHRQVEVPGHHSRQTAKRHRSTRRRHHGGHPRRRRHPLPPKQVVDRDAAADRIAATIAATKPSSQDLGRSEDEIMQDSIADIAQSRRERRSRET